jgi:hypothetical protein
MKTLDKHKAEAVLVEMVKSEVAQKTIMFSDKSTT